MDTLLTWISDKRPPVLFYNRIEKHTAMFTFFNSELFDFELTRILGCTSAGGCDIAEFLSAVGKIRKHDAESWFAAWSEQGDRAQRIGVEAFEAGFRGLARNAFLRAANYYRAAPYMLPVNDSRIVLFAEKSVRIFERATGLMDGEVISVEIPYEKEVDLPGYLYLPPTSAKRSGRTPVVINLGGADSTKEELYFFSGAIGPQLGYAVMTFDGPGQGVLVRKHGIPLRPDFEVCSCNALDYLALLSSSRPDLELDLNNIGIVGGSTGGYFALRTATDPRIKACVAIDPFFSLWELALTRVPKGYIKLWQDGWVSDGLFDYMADLHSKYNFPTRWEGAMGKQTMGVKTTTAMLRRFQQFSLVTEKEGRILDNVKCPVFLTGPGAGRDMYSSADESTFKIHRLLTNVSEHNKEIWVPTDVAEGGLTAKVGAWALLAQKCFQFLDKHLQVDRKSL